MSEQLAEALLRLKDVRSATGLSRSSIYAFEQRGEFPKRVSLGARTVAWKASEIQNWIESRQRKVA